jgi:hypothetical protein
VAHATKTNQLVRELIFHKPGGSTENQVNALPNATPKPAKSEGPFRFEMGLYFLICRKLKPIFSAYDIEQTHIINAKMR